MPISSSDIIFEDNHLLVVNKRAPLATMGVADDRPSLIAEAKEYIRRKYNKPGNVFLGVVSRLDTPVTGIVVLARTSKAASRLSKQFRNRVVDKQYLALVDGHVIPEQGECVDWIVRHPRHRKVLLADESAEGAQLAKLEYESIQHFKAHDGSPQTMLAIKLHTGRKHQIRIQLSSRGHPILGDRKYGSDISFANGIALHGRSLTIEHPTLKHEMTFVTPFPKSWRRQGIVLDGG
ncbi:MAG: RluA family pseudouridine synthase [Planctomycetales bacterium]|nr:RluA family pseudouridine synthase [Planctomycetales bacterium]